MHIPTDLGGITPAWLTRVLIENGAIRQTAVVAVDCQPLGHNYGHIETFRLQLTYASLAAGAPQTLVAKLSQRDPALGMGQREINFYQQIAARVALPTPRCYYCGHDETTDTYVFLLEDLGDGCMGDDLKGATRRQAERAVQQLAVLHATWWERPDLDAAAWIPTQPRLDGPTTKEAWQRTMRDSWDRFAVLHAGRIPAPMAAAWPLLVRHGPAIRRQSLVPPLTLCHGDFRLGNMSFGSATRGRSLTVFDWELLRRGQGPLDLSYFMIWGLDPALRRQAEKPLLQTYCAVLEANGVEGYTIEQCYRGYRIALYDLILPTLVEVATLVDFSIDRVRQLAAAFFTRTSAALTDHPITDLIKA